MKQCDEFERLFPVLYPHYRYESELFFQFCNSQHLDFCVDAVRAYNQTIPHELKLGTYNKRLAAAKKIVQEWAQKISQDEYASVTFHLKSIKGKKKSDNSVESDRWHTPVQIRRMQEASSKRTGLMILFLSCTGVRVAEAAGIRLCDISNNPESCSVTINGKGNKERKIPVSSDLIQRIKKAFKSCIYLFETYSHEAYDPDIFSRQITRAGKKIGIKTSAHRMRHSFATQFLNDHPGKFKELSKHLGHSSVQITLDNYAHNKMVFSDLSESTSAFKPVEKGNDAGLPHDCRKGSL